VAQTLAALLGKDIAPLLPGEYRANDTRSCTADITKAKHLLHWSPILPLKKGLQELIAWSREQPAEDHFTTAAEALRSRGLQR
jgi:nucleoside-diphosphate-sugar epimerase